MLSSSNRGPWNSKSFLDANEDENTKENDRLIKRKVSWAGSSLGKEDVITEGHKVPTKLLIILYFLISCE